jgi:hypothetical protein
LRLTIVETLDRRTVLLPPAVQVRHSVDMINQDPPATSGAEVVQAVAAAVE